MAGLSLKVGIISLLGGLVPACIWLWFWLQEDEKKPEPRGLLILTFIIGMVSVFVVLPVENFLDSIVSRKQFLTVFWAAAEELIKYVGVLFVAIKSRYADEPIDFAIYMMTGALGFAALENALFLIDPVAFQGATVSLLTGNFRFLGAMLLHTICSGAIGIALGLGFYHTPRVRRTYLLIGLLLAITLHSIFNFLIMNGSNGLFSVFSLLWGVAIIVLLLFEQLRRM